MKITIELDDEVLQSLDQSILLTGKNAEVVISESILLNTYLLQYVKNRAKILIYKSNRDVRELIFK